jgi:hypothetical protein
MATVSFIPISYIKRNTLLDSNIDEKTVRIALIDTQEQDLMPAIGTSMYNYLCNGIINKNFDQLHQWLMVAKIWPCLLHGIQAKILKHLSLRYTNAGIETMDKNGAIPASIAQINSLAKDRESSMHQQIDLLIRYLTTHSSSFTEWLVITPDGKIPEIEQSTVDFYYEEELGPIDFGRRSPATYGMNPNRIF